MIEHTEKVWPSGNKTYPDPAQAAAELCGRQEVNAQWYLDNMLDCAVWAWVGGDEYGLDPWRYDPEFDVNALTGEIIPSGTRLFVQKSDLPAHA